MPIEQFTAKDLAKKLEVILQSWALYRVLEYTGANELYVVPKHLSLYCNTCQKDTFWETRLEQNITYRAGFTSKEYTCRNCGLGTVRYYFYWKEEEKSSEFLKVGQRPELEEQVSGSLGAALNTDNLKMYKTALRLRNFNLGIAAVAYMRRIVENRMNDMLDVLYEAAIAHNAPAEILAQHEGIKREKRFSVKVGYAGDLLPRSLRPAGQPNPIAILHELASEGLHSRTDEECIDIFDECRETFEHVFGKMRIETEAAKAFVKEMAKLAERRAKGSC
jgi:hypothetical protein